MLTIYGTPKAVKSGIWKLKQDKSGGVPAPYPAIKLETVMTMSINEICQILEPVQALHRIGSGNAGYQQCLAALIKQANKQVGDMTVDELMALDRRASSWHSEINKF